SYGEEIGLARKARCLPAELARRMRIGIGGQAIAVEGRDPPVHRGVGRQARFDGEDVAREIAIAFRDGIETGLRAEGGKPRRPDMRWDQEGMRSEVNVQRDSSDIHQQTALKSLTGDKGLFPGLANRGGAPPGRQKERAAD